MEEMNKINPLSNFRKYYIRLKHQRQIGINEIYQLQAYNRPKFPTTQH